MIEREPMGTAGPIGLAKPHLLNDNEDGLFFVVNSDIVCNYEFNRMLEKHSQHQGIATICVKEVEDPSKFGVVVANDDGQVQEYRQNPTSFLSTKVNAGMYLFHTSVLSSNRIQAKPMSLEQEVLPQLASEGSLYCVTLDSFWMDIGLPHNFLLATQLFLQHLQESMYAEDNIMVGSGPEDDCVYKIFDGE